MFFFIYLELQKHCSFGSSHATGNAHAALTSVHGCGWQGAVVLPQ
jgi:hypothetical protein